jgi:Tol biopolymer transport system component
MVWPRVMPIIPVLRMFPPTLLPGPGRGAPARRRLPPSLWKVSIAGGQPVQLSDKFCFFGKVSPDGKLVACVLGEETPKAAPMKLLIIPIDGGEPVTTIDLRPTASPMSSMPFWLPDGRALTFMNRLENLPNVWSQPRPQ